MSSGRRGTLVNLREGSILEKADYVIWIRCYLFLVAELQQAYVYCSLQEIETVVVAIKRLIKNSNN